MKLQYSISIVANLLLIAALSGCGAEASSVVTASASTRQPPAMQAIAFQPPATHQPGPTTDYEKGDGSFKVYEYY